MGRNKKPGGKMTTLLGIVCAAVTFGLGCNTVDQSSRGMAALELKPFVEVARQSGCADARNRLFVVDHVLVFWAREGRCPDNSYADILYGRTVSDVLCEVHDSIAGPAKKCVVPGNQDIFEVMIEHLDEPHLGLDSSHTVQEVPL